LLGFPFFGGRGEVRVWRGVESEGLLGSSRGWRHGGLDDESGGFETDGGGGFRVGEDYAKGIEGQIGQVRGSFAEFEGAVGLGIGQGLLELGGITAPVGDGVAVNASRGGGFGEEAPLDRASMTWNIRSER